MKTRVWRSAPDTSPMLPSKSPGWLREELACGHGHALLLLDCRARHLYESAHVESAIHLAIPGLMLRRLRKGGVPVRSVIPNNEEQERFVSRCRSDTVLLYDEAPPDGRDGSLVALLLRKLRDEGCAAYYLEGGFRQFHSEYPEHCQSSVEVLCPSSLPPAPILGLGNLRISSDSSDVESDRDPCSATETERSPLSNSQPAFPVQIIPYLYLGCAKDSRNLDVLGKYNIRYILNVTTNLPNTFEHDGEFKYKQIPISDHWSQNLSQFFPEAISFIDEARSKKCGVLVHCLAGISRSVTVTVAYLMKELNLSLNDAYDFVKRKKSNISPNFNFMGQLLEFERTLGVNSPCDSQSPGGPFHFTTPANHVLQLDTLKSS